MDCAPSYRPALNRVNLSIQRAIIFLASTVTWLMPLLAMTIPLLVCDSNAQTAVPSSAILDTTDRDALPTSGVDFRWKEGIQLRYHYKDTFNLELGGRLLVDGGYIGA